MGARWRRPFCTSVRRDPVDAADVSEEAVKRNMSPRIRAKFVGLFPGTGGGGGGSKPSTPTLLLSCRTTTNAGSTAQAPATARPCTYNPPPPLPSVAIPVRRASSEPSSPRSPSRFALLMASLRLSSSRSRCGICTQSVKAPGGGDNGGGGSAAVFTAECSHTFHLSCIASRGSLVCPVCSATWRNSPLLSSVLAPPPPPAEHRKSVVTPRRNADNGPARGDGQPKKTGAPAAKVYNDDEPLLPSRGCAVRFNAIPEADDEDDDDNDNNNNNNGNLCSQGSSFCGLPHSMDRLLTVQAGAGYHGGVELSVLPEAALVSADRSHRNYVVAVKVKAPTEFRDGRAPIDLVTVLDVRGSMTGPKLHMLKRAMRQLIASLGPVDRLSIVAFSSTAAKRLLSLHRMSRQGQRYAVQVVDRLIVSTAAQGAGPATGASDALKKAAKVLEDRRERNPVATIMLLSDAQQQQKSKADAKKEHRDGAAAVATRFAHVDIPIHASGLGDGLAQKASDQDPFIQCVLSGLMRSSVMRDVYLQLAFPAAEISSVYSNSGGRAVALGGGGTCRLGDLRAGEERMLLVELRVPASAADRPHHNCMMIFRCSYSGAGDQMIRCQEQPLAMPPLQGCSNQQLRNLFVTTRAVAESRHLAELNDLATAVHLLSSARALLLQSPSDKHLLLSLEAELAELQQRRRVMMQSHSPCGVSRVGGQAQALLSSAVDDGREPLTPTSAWRAAERLAKLAIMRKSMNRVSDLHGFENARF